MLNLVELKQKVQRAAITICTFSQAGAAATRMGGATSRAQGKASRNGRRTI